MSLRYLTADLLLPISAEPIPQGVLGIDQAGYIRRLCSRAEVGDAPLERYQGTLLPGFVNAHCHLELSHLLGKTPTGKGLIPFIGDVISKRALSTPYEIQSAMRAADQAMYQAGIVAVGDISNQTDSLEVKRASKLHYHTFVEYFDLFQTERSQTVFDSYEAVYQAFTSTELWASRVPHAPYSVSPSLFGLLRQAEADSAPQTISIHNQETPAEQQLFRQGSGELVDFYVRIGMPLKHWQPTGKPSIYYALEQLDARHRWLFVHNTLTESEDIEAAQTLNPHTFWATCPNANLYIENALPRYSRFVAAGARVCIGTDSLTSNWSLSVLDELKTIKKYQSFLPTELLLRWATLHGAQALGLEAELGSLEPGKRPGILLLQGLDAQGELLPEAQVRRLDV